MKTFLTIVLGLLSLSQSYAASEVTIMSYNVENLFDLTDDPYSDDEFTPEGKTRWVKEKLDRKLTNLTKVVKSIKNQDGQVCPDVLGMVEVENAKVLTYWKDNFLKDCNYKITVVNANEPDPRGIKTALFSRFGLMPEMKPINHVVYESGRYIVEVPLSIKGNPLYIFMNHWRSRISFNSRQDGGLAKRILAAKVLKKRLLQINQEDPWADIVALGDFNDESEDESMKIHLGVRLSAKSLVENEEESYLWESSEDLIRALRLKIHSLRNEGLEIDEQQEQLSYKQARSTYFFHKERSYFQFDHLLISRGFFDDKGLRFTPGSFAVVRHPEFTDKSNKAAIPYKPGFRDGVDTDVGGASDHFPVVIRAVLQSSEE